MPGSEHQYQHALVEYGPVDYVILCHALSLQQDIDCLADSEKEVSDSDTPRLSSIHDLHHETHIIFCVNIASTSTIANLRVQKSNRHT